MPIVPLRRMAKGQKGIIHRVNASGELGRRIRDMGLVAGTPIWVQGRAPLKDPVAIRVRISRSLFAITNPITLRSKWNEVL